MQSNKYKIVIIGESMVGKTSILLRYIKGEFVKVDERTVNTNCISKMLTINNSNFALNIWDTAGEEKYHALAPLFYRDADGAVLAFDISKRESFEQVERWFIELNEHARDVQIILVGNKCDLPFNKHEVTSEEAKEIAIKYGSKYLAVSALDDKNINEIFSTLAVEIYHYKMKKEKDVVNRQRKKSIKLNNRDEGSDEEGCCK